MKPMERFYPETRFGGFTDIDGNVAFYARVNATLEPTMTVIDFGCGPGSLEKDPVAWRRSLRVLKSKAAHLIGLDVDEAAKPKPFVDEFRPLQNGQIWPVGPERWISCYVTACLSIFQCRRHSSRRRLAYCGHGE